MSEQKKPNMPGQGGGPGGEGGNGPSGPRKGNFMWIALVALLLWFTAVTFLDNGLGKDRSPLTTQELILALEEQRVSDAELSGSTVTGKVAMGDEELREFEATIHPFDDKVLKLLNEKAHGYDVKPDGGVWQSLLVNLLPWVLIIGFFYFFLFRQMRGGGPGGIMSFGRSRAQMIEKDKLTKTFADVAGIQEAKEEVQEIVEFLKKPERFAKIGGRLPKGVLMVGPPGTGKTLLAKAIAGEAGRPFFSISGSDFVEMFVGVGASRVRDLFGQAKTNAPCIIFLDEIDAVGRRRGQGVGGGNDEREQTLNAILVEMDGFEDNSGIIIIAATNRPDVLDPALLRPGRFDRQVHVDLPDIKGREEILKVHAKKVKLAANVDLRTIARGTPGFSGAQLENLLNEAAVIAALNEQNHVTNSNLEEARDKVWFGKQKRSKVMSEKDRRMTAYHEAGHAIILYMLPEVDTLHKVTIMPRGGALGMAMFLPEEDKYSKNFTECMGEIAVAFGGRVAEELFCDDISAGATGDIRSATATARRMVTAWGMSKMGLVAYDDPSMEDALGNTSPKQHYSEETLKHIDEEILKILDTGLERAREIIGNHKDEMYRIAEALLKYETLDAIEVEALIKGEDITERMEEKMATPSDSSKSDDTDKTSGAVAQDATGDSTTKSDSTPSEGTSDGTRPPEAATDH